MTEQANKPKSFEGELKEGQHIIFQEFTTTDAVTGMPTVIISVRQIESVDKATETMKLVGYEGSQPWYRIRYVVEGNKTFEYPGYDHTAIARDEGQITDETYLAIKKAEQGLSKWTDHGI